MMVAESAIEPFPLFRYGYKNKITFKKACVCLFSYSSSKLYLILIYLTNIFLALP
jgi:hypothetical protein